ncbi:LytR/AlgR family response regulator transcription factor [Mycoplasma sp. P36-A1]|uniref:LytR/AlgR family response regulator transcription factor n=1 Tax=Mycoplasma sp. P36-A1 TaxID=3252900 RepID=UPI003C2E48AB
MNKVRIAVCTQNIEIQNKIKTIILEYYRKRKTTITLDIFTNGNIFIEKALNKNYSFIYLDLDFKRNNGKKIIESIKTIIKSPTLIIFILDYHSCEKVIFPLQTFDIITKSFTKYDIHHSLDELNHRLNNNLSIHIKKIVFKTISGIINVPISNIYYIESSNRKVNIILNSTTFLLNEKMNRLTTKMVKHNFAIPHSSFIVNLSKISSIDNNKITMDNGDVIFIARTRKKSFKKQYLEYIKYLGY